jgi:MoaA/NifB/PqqE/SkfB family radical SAM enzyme
MSVQQHGERSPHAQTLAADAPRVVAWEVTRSCNLACAHCRASALCGPYEGELTTEEAFRLVDQIAELGRPILILTGGEPLLRADIWEIAERAMARGLHAVMAPNGTLVTPEVAARMREVGIRRISISIDYPNAEEHDVFRGVPGAFEGALDGVRNAIAAGVEVQINSTITKMNVRHLPALLELAERVGAVSFHPFMLVPTGRGKELEEQELPPEEYERALNWMYDAQQSSDLFFKPTDVPHYWRVMRQRAKAHGRKLEVHPHSHGGMNTLSRGCLAGVGFCFISHRGEVQPCGYFDVAPLPHPARPVAAQGEVRRVRVPPRLRRLPRTRLRGHRRLHGRGALLRLRAQGVAGVLTGVLCAAACRGRPSALAVAAATLVRGTRRVSRRLATAGAW